MSKHSVQHETQDFAKQWKQAAGTDFQPGFKDCLLVATCSDQRELRLPELLQPGSPLFQEALRVSLKMYQEHYLRDPEALHLLAAPVLIELENFMIKQATQSSPMLAMWATHDTTMLVLLAALGVWNGQWPPYTDTIVLEVYKETSISNSSAHFRFLHHGVPVVFPWCESISNGQIPGVPGLCNLQSFLPPWIVPYRNMQHLREACAKTIKTDPMELDLNLDLSQSNRFGESLGSISSFVMYGLSSIFFMFLGHSWRELSSRSSRRSQHEALLSF